MRSKYQPQSVIAETIREEIDRARRLQAFDTPLDEVTLYETDLVVADLYAWANAVEKELADAYERGYTDGALNPAGLQR